MKRRSFLAKSSLLLSTAILEGQKAYAEENKSLPLSQHVILITGGTSGIGETTSRVLAKSGATVVFCGRREHLDKKVQDEIRADGGKATYIKCDVRVESAVDELVRKTVALHGRIDSIFINAGIGQLPSSVHETKTASLTGVFETNCFGAFYCARAALPYFIKQKSGTMIFNTSYGVERVVPGEAVYSASKMAVDAFVRHIAVDYASSNIKVYALEPLCVKTPMIENRAKYLKRTLDSIGNPLLKRIIQPEEVAELVQFLLLTKTPLLSGTSFDLSAGFKWQY